MRGRGDVRAALAALATDGWTIEEDGLDPARAAARESLFAVGNGYLGLRGALDEAVSAHDPGVVLNGFHETWPVVYPEDAYGLARTGQTLVDVTDGTVLRLFADDEPVDPATARVRRHRRALDLRTGILTRETELETPRGQRLLVRSRRFASLERRHVAAIRYEVEALDAPVRVTVSSELVTRAPRGGADDPRRGRGFAEKVLVPLGSDAAGTRAVLRLATRASGLELACGIDHVVAGGTAASVAAEGDAAALLVHADLQPGAPLRVDKLLAYHWGAAGDHAGPAARTLDGARAAGFEALEAEHAAHVAAFWERSDVAVEGPPGVQEAVRFNLFQLMQATARGEGHGVPAKGVTGRGYEGHYFWDTEIYMVPFLAHTSPQWARQVLAFRCGMLGAARRRAQEVGHGGALFPWRTITGEEASAWYAAGTAQYHINADVAYALHQYNRVTGDLAFMLDHGAEVVVETARFWMELGFFSERRGGRFCIHGVTGPDEYTAVVDDNAYTNLMAKENLEIAVRVVEWLRTDPAAYAALTRATGLRAEEVEGWRRAAERMYVPRHDELGIVLQDERFLERKRWDFERTPADRYPLLLHYHPLELYRHQVIKQTDVVLAAYLVGDAMDPGEVRRTFDYYDPLTTGDSTLSACVQSVVASAVGYADKAMAYFLDALSVDLLDAHGNTADGIHVASCGGTWLALAAGFGGLRDTDGRLRFAPRLPEEWERLRFRLAVRGQRLEVEMTPAATVYRLLEGSGLMLEHDGEPVRLTPGATVVRAAGGIAAAA